MRTVLLIGSVLAAAACAGGANDSISTDTPVTTPSASTTTLLPFSEIVGHQAENAYDFVKLGEWVLARSAVDSLTAAVRASQPNDTVGYGRDLRESLAGLGLAVSRRSRARGLRDANHLTEIGALMGSKQSPPVPAAVTLLDYYGRELEIGAAEVDAAQLERAASGIRTTWSEVRPQVVARGGTAEAARFDGVVAQVAAARSFAQYARTATPLLDEVDALEAVFLK